MGASLEEDAGIRIVAACDRDGDDAISMADVTFPNATRVGRACFDQQVVLRGVCSVCHECGFDLMTLLTPPVLARKTE